MKRIFNTARIVVCFTLMFQIITACGTGKKTLQKPKAYQSAVNMINSGNQLYKQGCYENALEYVFTAHELFAFADYQGGVAKSFNNIGNIYRAKKDTESALLFLDEAVKVYKTMDDYRGVVQALSNKSAVCIDLKMFGEAEKLLNEVDRIATSSGFIYPPALNNRGILFIRLGKYAEAQDVLTKAMAVIDKNNFFEYTAVNFALGRLMVETKQYQKAESYFMEALRNDRKIGFNKGIADDLFAIGSLFMVLENYEMACDYLQRSLKVYTLLNDKENAEKSFTLLKKAVNSASGETVDITITEFFIDLWNRGDRLTAPCE